MERGKRDQPCSSEPPITHRIPHGLTPGVPSGVFVRFVAGWISMTLGNNPLTSADYRSTLTYDVPLRFDATVGGVRSSRSDPTSTKLGRAFVKALHTQAGPATVAVFADGPGRASFAAWGPGAALGAQTAKGWLGLDDPLETFDPSPHPLVAKLARAAGPRRLGRFGPLVERLVPTILGQLVIAKEAKRSYNRLVRQHARPAPGPFALLLPPHPDWLAEQSIAQFHVVGVEAKRAKIIKRVCARANRIERLRDLPVAAAYPRLLAVRGLGPWTVSSVAYEVFGDPDAVVVGDYNLPHTVAFALTGKRRSNDEEMLELLAPFAPHRGRVQRLLKTAGPAARPPRHGPKLPFREIEQH